jgi:hypothetical protein
MRVVLFCNVLCSGYRYEWLLFRAFRALRVSPLAERFPRTFENVPLLPNGVENQSLVYVFSPFCFQVVGIDPTPREEGFFFPDMGLAFLPTPNTLYPWRILPRARGSRPAAHPHSPGFHHGKSILEAQT